MENIEEQLHQINAVPTGPGWMPPHDGYRTTLLMENQKIVKELTREQWDAMSPEQVARWMRWVMPQGAEAPLPVNPPDRGNPASRQGKDSGGASVAGDHHGLDR
jgi:hypothetical protein